jgi:hypothetical protein
MLNLGELINMAIANTLGKPTKRELLENALAQSQDIGNFAQNPQNFGGGYAGAFGAIAQGLTAGIGAYAQYKQRQKIAQTEAEDVAKFSDFATQKGDVDLASIADQLTPETRQAYYMQKTMPAMTGSQYQDPASVREYQYFQNLAPEKQAQYLNLKRNLAGEGGVITPQGEIKTLGGYGEAGARKAGMQKTAENISDLQYKPQIAGASSFQSESAKEDVQAQEKAKNVLGQFDNITTTLDLLQKHPGLSDITGAKGGGAILSYFGKEKPIQGTNAAGAQALLDQVKGQQFLQAFEGLKGGGQISEKEGEAATKALSAINSTTSEKDLVKNIQVLKDIMEKGKNRAMQRAGQGYQRASSVPQQSKSMIVKKYNPQTGRIE